MTTSTGRAQESFIIFIGSNSTTSNRLTVVPINEFRNYMYDSPPLYRPLKRFIIGLQKPQHSDRFHSGRVSATGTPIDNLAGRQTYSSRSVGAIVMFKFNTSFSGADVTKMVGHICLTAACKFLESQSHFIEPRRSLTHNR